MIGKEVCMMHGGKSRGGVASPRFKNGRYSRYLPQRLLEQYNEILNDPRLMEIREDIALFDALTMCTLEEMARIEDAWASGAISETILHREQRRLRRELGKMFLRRANLVLAETTRQTRERTTLTAEQAMAFVAAMADAVTAHVKDEAILNTVVADFNRIIDGRTNNMQ
jgi:hypothetical protein